MARRLCEATGRRGILLDITGHGESPAPAHGSVTFQSAAEDIHTTLQGQLLANQFKSLQIVGHSLGGRLALYYATRSAYSRPSKLWLLDPIPGRPDKNIMTTLQATMLIEKRAEEEPWISRTHIHTALTKAYGVPSGVATWLSSQFDVVDKQRFTHFSTAAATSLAEELEQHNIWEQLNVVNSDVVVHLVQAGSSTAWNEEHTSQRCDHMDKYPEKFYHHVLPDAGHWVHIDDPDGLMNAFIKDANW